MSATMLASGEKVAVSPREMVMFGCPACGNSLRVPQERAHESGPCPVCHTVIAGPRPAPPEPPAPSLLPLRGGGGNAPPCRESRSFTAHKVIMPGPDVELDETWKERYERELRAWRKRKDFEKKVCDFFQSRLWKRARLAGVVVLMLILAGAVGFLYSEKKMGQRSDGIFDTFKKAANPF